MFFIYEKKNHLKVFSPDETFSVPFIDNFTIVITTIARVFAIKIFQDLFHFFYQFRFHRFRAEQVIRTETNLTLIYILGHVG